MVVVGIAISRRSCIQFNHFFRILVDGVAVGGLPIVPVHSSDRNDDGLDGKVEKREKEQSRQDDHQTLIRQRR